MNPKFMIKINQIKNKPEKEEDLNHKNIKLPNVQKTNNNREINNNKRKMISKKNNQQSLIPHFKKAKKFLWNKPIKMDGGMVMLSISLN